MPRLNRYGEILDGRGTSQPARESTSTSTHEPDGTSGPYTPTSSFHHGDGSPATVIVLLGIFLFIGLVVWLIARQHSPANAPVTSGPASSAYTQSNIPAAPVQSSMPTPEQTQVPPELGLPSNLTAQSIQFYESGYEGLPQGSRTYANRFPTKGTRYINWEVHFQHPPLQEPVSFTIDAIWYGPDAQVLARQSVVTHLEQGWENSYTNSNWGNQNGSIFSPGTYRVELVVSGKQIANATFETYQEEMYTRPDSLPPVLEHTTTPSRVPSGGWRRFGHGRPEPEFAPLIWPTLIV